MTSKKTPADRRSTVSSAAIPGILLTILVLLIPTGGSSRLAEEMDKDDTTLPMLHAAGYSLMSNPISPYYQDLSLSTSTDSECSLYIRWQYWLHHCRFVIFIDGVEVLIPGICFEVDITVQRLCWSLLYQSQERHHFFFYHSQWRPSKASTPALQESSLITPRIPPSLGSSKESPSSHPNHLSAPVSYQDWPMVLSSLAPIPSSTRADLTETWQANRAYWKRLPLPKIDEGDPEENIKTNTSTPM